MTPTSTDQTPIDTDKDQTLGKHDDLTGRIIGVFFDVYNELGCGFLESVYKESMRIALAQTGLNVRSEVPVPVYFRGELAGIFGADLVVDDSVLIELKACDAIVREHESQTLNYLRATNLEVALLMNFGPTPKFKRLILDNKLKKSVFQSVQSVSIGVKPFSEVAK
jgi:GxxExxY protein